MKTMIVTLPEKEEPFFLELLRRLRFKSRVISNEEIVVDKWEKKIGDNLLKEIKSA